MLNKEVFFDKMDQLLMSFPNWSLRVEDKEVVKFWYSKFQSMDDERFSHMVDQYIEHEKFFPTINGLKQHDTLMRKSATQIRHEQMLKESGLM